MGTHSCTRIQKDNDFIEMYTSWKGKPSEVKKDLENTLSDWENFINYIKQKIVDKDLNLPYLSKWVDEMNYFLSQTKLNPSLESYAMLLCNRDFDNHSVLPIVFKDSKVVAHWDHDCPNFLLNLLENGTSYNIAEKLPYDKVQEKAVEKDYFIVRIANDTLEKITPENCSDKFFTDLKVKGMTKDEFKTLVFSLPMFWLELHLLACKANFEKNKEHPILQSLSNSTLKTFYSFNNVKDVFYEIYKYLPLNLSSYVLANHLYLLSAGKVQPLTRGELLWSHQQTPDDIIQLSIVNAESKTNLILIHENVDCKNKAKILIDNVNQRFDHLQNQILDNFVCNHVSDYITKDEMMGFNYENNMVKYFDVLTSLSNHLKNNQKLKNENLFN